MIQLVRIIQQYL